MVVKGMNMWQKMSIGCLLFAWILLPVSFGNAASPELVQLYNKRPDLQLAFEATTFRAVPHSAAGFLIDLEDWASQYGWQEDASLQSFAPTSNNIPKRHAGAPDPVVPSTSFIVIDRSSGQILAAKGADVVWPIASLTKLVTTNLVLEAGIPLTRTANILTDDDVGGAKLYVADGATMSVDDLLYSALVGSANNAANALSRTLGESKEQFIARMNGFASRLNLEHTEFVDPTGIELGNVSTAREYARLAGVVFEKKDIRRYTSTASRIVTVLSDASTKNIQNTNWMLWKPEYDDVYVISGKTGYLIESGWNLAVDLRPSANDTDRELLIVLFGATSRADSFIDAKALANWTWRQHDWEARPSVR